MQIGFSKIILLVAICLWGLVSVSGQGPSFNWKRLTNPVYEHPDWSVKDACMVNKDEWNYLFFSAFFYDAGRERSHVVCVRTRDFISFSEPLFIWSGMEEGWIGMCSPNISRINGLYYLTYNSWGDNPQKVNQLFYAVSKDLERWDRIQVPLAASLTQGKRSIDAAITFYNTKWYLIWKEEQTAKIAWADSLASDSWHLLGTPAQGRWFENAQFLELQDTVYMLVTGSAHRPHLCHLVQDPALPDNWLNWSEFVRLDVTTQSWNTDNVSNSGFLADWRKLDGYYYLLYAGRTEKISHRGRGDNKLGLARSKDLVHWESPPERAGKKQQ